MFDRDQLATLEQLIRKVAQEELMPRFERVEMAEKADGSVLTEADLATQQRLIAELSQQWPTFEVLGEEMTEAQQLDKLENPGEGLWLLDPLDGTANFASSIPYFAISAGLVQDGKLQAGIVYDPTRDECFSALAGEGAWLNGMRLQVKPVVDELSKTMAMVDMKRLPQAFIEHIAKGAPFRSQRNYGSVALDWCWLAASRVQVYLHGGQRLWDFAAGSLVFREAGGFGGVMKDYAGAPQTGWNLKPHIGMGATSASHWQQWLAYINESLS